MTRLEAIKFVRLQLPDPLQAVVSDGVLERYPCGSPSPREARPIKDLLDAATIDSLWIGPVRNSIHADACRSGLWLLVGELDRAHRICQDIDRPEGSWWHAIVHRLEGDFWNSRYWYRRVGPHPAWSTVVDWANRNGLPNKPSPDALVDLAEQGGCRSSNSDDYQSWSLCEWAGLFRYCHEKAEK